MQNPTAHGLALAAFCTLLGAACANHPVPMAAHPGSTVAIPVGSEEVVGSLAAYGTAGVADPQRGQLVFRLLDETTHVPTGDVLTVRAVTRAYPDPASEAGIENEAGDGFIVSVGIGQVLAVVDVPTDVDPGNYDLEITRERPAGIELPPEETPAYRLPFTVLPGIEQPTPLEAFFSFTGTSFIGPLVPVDLSTLYPHPKVIFTLPDPPPAAAHLVIGYPGAKIEKVVAVFEEQHLGRTSIVMFTDDPVLDRVTIDLIDPLETGVSRFSIAFRPAVGGALVDVSDFAVLEEVYYDAYGAPFAGSSAGVLIR